MGGAIVGGLVAVCRAAFINQAKNREPPLVSCASKKEAATAYVAPHQRPFNANQTGGVRPIS